MNIGIIILTVVVCSVSAELPSWMKKSSEPDLREMGEKEMKTEYQDLMQRSLILDTCEVQTAVLSKLRDLVISSISQVKMCMALRGPDKFSSIDSRMLSI